jgi:hypothetical protein
MGPLPLRPVLRLHYPSEGIRTRISRPPRSFVSSVQDIRSCVPGRFHCETRIRKPESNQSANQCQEASSNSITLSDDDPEIVERMINYLYSHRYDDEEDYDHDCLPSEVDGKAVIEGQHGVGEEQPSSPSSSSPSPSSSRDLTSTPSPLSITSSTTIDTCTTAQTARAKDSTAVPNSLRVYALADKYLISPLKELARIRFTKWVAHHWSSPRFVAAVREIFDGESGNYAELHEAVMTPLVLHADHLLCFDPDEVENVLASSMNQLLHDYTDISVEILRRVLERNRISQRGLEVDVAELHSRVDALRSENRKIALLQSQNQRLTKELLELQMTRIGWRRGSGASGGNNAHTITSTDVARRVGNRRTAAMTGNGRLS